MDNVVHLNFKGSNVQEEFISLLSCAICKNKTFSVVYDGGDFPIMKCSACGSHTGRIGWADAEVIGE